MYKVVGHKALVNQEGNESCEVREFTDMTQDEVEEMMQISTTTDENGKETTIDLRYL